MILLKGKNKVNKYNKTDSQIQKNKLVVTSGERKMEKGKTDGED